MAVTTNNQVRLTIRYDDYSTHNYTFDGIPDEQIAGVVTRAQAANTTWQTDNMHSTFVREEDNTVHYSTGVSAIRITSTEEEVIFGG